MADLWGLSDAGISSYVGKTETLAVAMPGGRKAFAQTGGPFLAWFMDDLFFGLRDNPTGTTPYVYRYNRDNTVTAVFTGTPGQLGGTTYGAVMVALEGSLYLVTLRATGTGTIVSSTDGVSFAAAGLTGGTWVGALSLHHPTYYEGLLYLIGGDPAGAAAADHPELIALAFDNTPAFTEPLTLPSVGAGTQQVYGLGVFNGLLYVVGLDPVIAALPEFARWDGATTVAGAASGLPADDCGGRPCLWEHDGSLYLAWVSNGVGAGTAGQVRVFKSTDGLAFTEVTDDVAAPNLAYRNVDMNCRVILEDGEALTGRRVYLSFAETSTSTPLQVLYRWDGAGFVDLRVVSDTSTGHSLALFSDAIPHARITAASDNGNRTVTVDYTLFDPDSELADVRLLYSLDQGGNYLEATPTVGTVTTSLTTDPAGIAKSFTWDLDADAVPPGADVLFKVVANRSGG